MSGSLKAMGGWLFPASQLPILGGKLKGSGRGSVVIYWTQILKLVLILLHDFIFFIVVAVFSWIAEDFLDAARVTSYYFLSVFH